MTDALCSMCEMLILFENNPIQFILFLLDDFVRPTMTPLSETREGAQGLRRLQMDPGLNTWMARQLLFTGFSVFFLTNMCKEVHRLIV